MEKQLEKWAKAMNRQFPEEETSLVNNLFIKWSTY